MNTRSIKKQPLLIGSLIFLSLTAAITVWYNLIANSVYYAKHIPHKEGENPELVFIIDNLLVIPKPYDLFDYNESSHQIFPKSTHYLSYNFYAPYKGYMLFKGKEGSFTWNDNGKFKYYSTYREPDEHLQTEEYRIQAEQELHAIIDPIIELQEEPTLNLQWLFNWVHRERFNK